ncbi:MAG: FAD-binding protein [Bacteroidales bacterium]|jgi:electron transfer flavoprotein alpha subunit|nr:FAD-binding protein [Bacteroidales bacterium]
MALTIISLIKQVPLPSEMRMGEDGLMDRTKAKSSINMDCQYGLEAGLQLKKMYPDATLMVCSMGPKSFEASLRKALAMGYDEAYLLSDRKLGGSDTFATGMAIATMLKYLGFTHDRENPFIILTGRQTSDGDTAHVPSQVAANLGIPQATFVERIQAEGETHVIAKRIIEGGYQMMRLPMPCVISLTPTGISPRKPSLKAAMKARITQLTTLSVTDIRLTSEKIGIGGSPTIVSKVVEMHSERPPLQMTVGATEREKVHHLIEMYAQETTAVEKKQRKERMTAEAPDYPVIDIRKGYKGILCWAEIADGNITRSSLEILSAARQLATQLDKDTKITSLLIGHQISDKAQTLIAHGADEVVVVDDARLEEYLVLPFASIFTQVIQAHKPEIVLFAATTSGRELAPRIAVHTGSGVTADCTKLEIGEYVNKKEQIIIKPILHSHRPTYGESKLATIIGFAFPQISTARPGTFEVPLADSERKGIIRPFTPVLEKADFRTEIIQTVRGEGGLQHLFEAEVIVGGGRGVTADNLRLVKELTEAFKNQGVKAEWAASRTVVDEGFAEYARQIGQTGKTVRPKLYIAVGISGAIQHIAGIKEAGKIIAIDQNPKANIFHHADYGIVGKYQDVIPELIEQAGELCKKILSVG